MMACSMHSHDDVIAAAGRASCHGGPAGSCSLRLSAGCGTLLVVVLLDDDTTALGARATARRPAAAIAAIVHLGDRATAARHRPA